MTSYIWDICYQLCCHSLSNFEPQALPHQCRSSPNLFTSSYSSKVISWEIFTLRFHGKLLFWVSIVFSEKVFLYLGGICYRQWWPMVTYWRPMCCGFVTSYLVRAVPCNFYIIVSSLWFFPIRHQTCWFLSIALPPSVVPLTPAEPEATDAVTEPTRVAGQPKCQTAWITIAFRMCPFPCLK